MCRRAALGSEHAGLLFFVGVPTPIDAVSPRLTIVGLGQFVAPNPRDWLHHEIHRSNDVAIVRTTIVDVCECRSWGNRRLPAPSAFSRFPPVHGVDLEGQQRVEGGPLRSEQRSPQLGGKLPLRGRLGNDWSPRQSRHSICEREIALTAETLARRGVADAFDAAAERVPSARLLLVLQRTAYDILCVHADASEGIGRARGKRERTTGAPTARRDIELKARA